MHLYAAKDFIMKDIKVSVIIPVYNAEKHLEECLNSVISQTLKEIEIICVDDGSSDSSPQILEQYKNRDERIIIITQENSFAGTARNNGMKSARGKYLVFWDADDIFSKNALKKMYKSCEKHHADICVCAGKRMDNKSGRVFRTRIYLNKKNIRCGVPFSKNSNGGRIFNFTTNVPWNKMFLRSFVAENDLKYQEIPQANDAYFVMTALFFAKKITTVSTPLITYREDNPESITGKVSKNSFCVFEAFKKTYTRLSADPGFNEDIRQSFANKALDTILYSLKTQRSADAYELLYNKYKNEALPMFGISGREKGYFYNKKQEEDLTRMEQYDAFQFLLYKFRQYERNYRLLSGNTAVRVIRLLFRL